MSYTTSFLHTARVKYGVDFDSSNINELGEKLKQLRNKIESKQQKEVHVGFEVSLEHVIHVENLFNQILEKYREVFHVLPPTMKIYEIIRKLKASESPSAKDLAKEVLTEVLSPEKVGKLTKAERIKADAEKVSKQRALDIARKKSAKGK